MVYDAIMTKYLCTTNHRGSRIKATCRQGSVTVPFEHGLSIENNHIAACVALTRKLGWGGNWAMGDLFPNGYVFVRCNQP